MNFLKNVEKIIMNIPNYCVIMNNKTAIINKKTVSFNKEEFNNLIRIIRKWNFNYVNNEMSGEYYYKIRIFENSKEYVYRFIGEVPDDFDKLIQLVGDIYAK